MDRTTEEAISSLQAQVSVQHLVLLSVIKAHPQPAALLQEWHRVRADAIDCKSAIPSTSRHSELVRERCENFAEEWTAQLVDAAVDSSTHKPA
ncbi:MULTISPECIES: hypothetical protein [Lysobacter]|uniref:hypothetical protein n=1 Tax=Lysobacter TaxID=68 RepID=UPI0011DFA4A6|nr:MULTISPECIES: hypothetical protein [Lysobacter]UJB19167.1 hypothetical protein L1A79_23120 [Lysobacter capsici]UJQ27108.1 hypothetical protein L2D09_16765 [Lysobacter gummosus]